MYDSTEERSSRDMNDSDSDTLDVNYLGRKAKNEINAEKSMKRAEEDRLLRQRWAESKLLEEAVAKKLEKYLQDQLLQKIEERKQEFEAEIGRRVKNIRVEIEAKRVLEMERKRKEEEDFLRLKKAEEMRLKELNDRTQKEEELQREAEKKRLEAIRLQKYQEEIKQLEEKQKREAEELKRIKREQEIILNKKHVRPKLSFSLKNK